MVGKKILLVQLYSNGDCLYATVISRQIKEVDYPGCHLTWAVAKNCRQSIENNPYIDAIWETPPTTMMTDDEWLAFQSKTEQEKQAGEFDLVFYTQIIGDNSLNFDGGIRSSLYNNYPHPISVSHQPILILKQDEVDEVKQFAAQHHLETFKQVLLVECGPQSFQSALNPEAATVLAEQLTVRFPDCAVILSSNKKIDTQNPHIVDGSVLNLRANAELTKYCTLFIGCSSGISWLATTDWAKPLPKVIVTDDRIPYASSMVYDHAYIGLPTDHIIELREDPSAIEVLFACICEILDRSFPKAREKYHIEFKRKNYRFVYTIARSSFARGNFLGPLKMPAKIWRRNGFTIKVILYLLKAYIKLPIFLFKRKNKRIPTVETAG